ncbi:MAG: PKD domain-containing protein [Bacteroidetes bacterium]|nr:MAG: PKD domain-containing protein [Bacteroidota bacterium]
MSVKQKLPILFFLILFAFLPQKAEATHVMGTDFAYECLGNGKYRIILNLYRDCNGINLAASENYFYRCENGTGAVSRTARRISITDVTGIDSSCGVVSKCTPGSNFGYGIQQHVYVDTVDFSSLNCCEVVVYYSVCCRNNGISTGASGQNFYSQMTINKCASTCNSSPKYTNYPVAIVCRNQDVVLNSGAVDTIDVGDSLSYELTTSLTGATTNVTYTGQFAYNRPLTFWGFPNQNQALPGGFHMDPTTGDLSFRPTVLNQISVVAIKVKEWRKDASGIWQQIGESRRDLQVIVINCLTPTGNPNSLPVLNALPPAKVCSGDSICMKIVTSDADAADSVKLSWNKGIPGATFSIANPGGKIDTAFVCWRPGVTDTSSVPYAFTVTARDNACPFAGSSTRAYAIQVGLKPETQMSYSVDTCGLIEMNSVPQTVYVDPVYTWLITDASNDTIFYSASLAKNAYAFLDPGKYYVYHKIATAFPCFSEFRDSFEIAPYPVIRSSLPNDTSVCQYSTINLSSTVNGGVAPLRYSWNTSLADTSDQLSLVIDRDSLLVVTVSDKYGCYHRDTVTATSLELPKSKIHIDESSQCLKGNQFSFIDSTAISSGTLSRTWHFGNGDTSTSLNPVYSYSAYDTFQIALYSESNLGCLDTAYDSVWVHPQAIPKIQVNDSAQCLWGNSYQFDALASSMPYEQITKWYWNFGDTTTDTLQIAQKVYSRFGYMQVQLVTETQSACLDTVRQVVRVNPNPVAKIGISDSLLCLSGNDIQLNASNSYVDDGYINSISWLKGDGSADTGWVPMRHQYAYSDTFFVRMTLLSDQQCGDTAWQKVVIHPQAQINLSVDTTDACLRGNQFNFNASASTLSSGSISNYAWNFDDAQFGNGATVSHGYAGADTFHVRLITTTALMCSDTAYQYVITHPQAVPDFISNADSQCLNLNDFSFNASGSSIAWGYIKDLTWDFGNGQTDTGWLIPSVVYQNAGPFAVQLVTQSDYGCRDTLVKGRQVHPRAVPSIQSNYFDHCFSFHAFQFDGSGSSIPWGSVANYNWTLEDGSILNGIQPAAYSFASADSFDVRLITTSNYGCLDTVYSEVVVHPMPVSNLVYNEDQHCMSGNDFRFDAGASSVVTGSIAQYDWDYGDGNADNGSLIPHKTYAAHGTYTLKLRIESALGCADSLNQTIVVHPQMVPQIQIVDSFVCVRGNFFDLNASSSSIPLGSITGYQWDFSDGSTQNGVNIGVKNFNYYDTFDIRLRTLSDQGCTDSIFRRIVVYPQPTARFVVNDSIQCFDQYQAFSFDASSSSVPSPWAGITEYAWTSSDVTQYTGVQWQNKAYASRGVYTTQLRVKSQDGCRDTVEKQVHFYPAMQPSFTTPDTAQCFNEHDFVFDASVSSIPLGSIQQYTWKYEDLSSSTGMISPSKRFANFDTFTVWLVTTSNEFCEDSVSREIIVFESPKADFSVPETCLKQASVFTDLSVIGHDTLIAWYWDFGNQQSDTVQHPIHYYKATNKYDVMLRVESNNNCFHDTVMQDMAWVKPLPVSRFNYQRADFDFEIMQYDFTDLSSDALTWNWDFGDGQQSLIQHNTIEYDDTAHYLVQLIVSNSYACLDTSYQTVWALPEFLVYVPNAFTPNGDLKNEGFAPKATAYYERYSMKIYNRWGQLMFETDDLSKSWDGTFNGAICDMGLYTYAITIIDLYGKAYYLKGNITLMR